MINFTVNNGLQPAVKAPETSPAPQKQQAPNEAEPIESQARPEQQDASPVPDKLEAAVSKVSDHVQNIQRTLSFSVEEETGMTVVKVFDSETEELIRQIPAEEIVKLAASIEEFAATLFLEEQV